MPTPEEELKRLETMMMDVINSLHQVRRAISEPNAEAPVSDGRNSAIDVPRDLIPLKEAAQRAGRSPGRLREWARQFPVSSPGGFAVNLRGRWFCSAALLRAHLARSTSSRRRS